MSEVQNTPVDVGAPSKSYVFTARCTSSPCCSMAPQLWCDSLKHGVEYAGDGKWVFHRTVTSHVTTTFVCEGHYKMSQSMIRGHQSTIMSSSLHTAFVGYRSGLTQIVPEECFKPLGCELLPKPFAETWMGKSFVFLRFEPYDHGMTMILCAAHLPHAVNLSKLDEFNDALFAMYLGQPSCIQTFLISLGCRKMRAVGCCPPGGICVYGKSQNVGVTREFTL